MDLNAALGRELRNDHTIGNLLEDGRVSLAAETIVECVQVGGGDDILQVRRLDARIRQMIQKSAPIMSHLIGVESQWVRGTLGATPEGLPCAADRILGQAVEQLANGVVVLVLKLHARPDDALFERERLVGDKVRDNLFNLLLRLTGVLEVVLEEVWFR